jgi:hypothetical protein
MKYMGIKALYSKLKTTMANKEYYKYKYLLKQFKNDNFKFKFMKKEF